MTAKSFGKKLLKGTGIFLGILIVLLVSFHFWFKAHAKQILEDMVESKSNGKLKLKIGKLHFNYFSRRIELEKAVFYNTDTINGTTAYRFSVEKMQLRVKALWPLVFKKQILIDSLTLQNPNIKVTRLRAIEKPGNKIKKDVSIPEEMGKVYSSIQDALKVLHVKRFQIDDGTFTLVNKIESGQLPLTVSNIHFYIDNLQVDSSKLTGREKIMFSENVVLRSTNQNIIFPDGRHRLSFSRFRINLKNKLVEFDSCTIAATKGDSTTASFKVFFDALLLTNIDFDTLYKAEVIKADSVYCLNPKFNLEVDLSKKRGTKKPQPKLENIIKQLTGDLQLGFVVVSNADFNIKTVKEGVPSSFTFSNNNFEMQGLGVDQGAPKPVTVKSFAMAIRNYENFIKDSSYSVKFDSILFKDDKITLSNFLFNKLNNGKIINTFSVPQFNLVGLSWDDLVFEKKLKADQALMFNPHINFTAPAGPDKKQGKQNLFQSLGAVNEYMDLQQLDIIDGDIDLKLKNNLQVQLNNATLSVQSHSLLKSKKLASIKNSLTQLKFEKGIIRAGNMDIELHDIVYHGTSGQLGATSIDIRDKEKNMLINLYNTDINKLLVDETAGNVYAEGVKWQKGDVKINLTKQKSNAWPSIELRDVQGAATSFNGIIGGKSVSTRLDKIFFRTLEKKDGSKLDLNGLHLNGTQLQVKDNNQNLSVTDYDFSDNKSSIFRQVSYKINNSKINTDISIPVLTVTPHVQSVLNGHIILDGVTILKPIINLHLVAQKGDVEKTKNHIPEIDISEIRLTQPAINFTQAKNSRSFHLNWHGDQNVLNFLQATNLHTNEKNMSLDNLRLYITDFTLVNPNGKTFNTSDGKVSALIENINIHQEADQPVDWTAIIADFDAKDFRLDSIGKSKGNFTINTGSLHNLSISSSTITNLQKLAGANTSFRLQQFTGSYSTAIKNLRWFNAGFNRKTNFFSLDSFSLLPVLSRDSFLAKQSFQTDYVTIKSGRITVGPVDIDSYIKNKTLNIGTATIDSFIFTDYKDKQLPFNAGIIKPLPVNMIKKIPQKLSIDTVLFSNAHVTYTEYNEKTKQPGTIPVSRMTVRLLKVKNYNYTPTDSLSIQANGYLMDTAWIRLRVKESYTDTLGGFLMTLRMKPADLTVLNPALVPLASIKLESAFLDTLSMRAVGREYLSLGEMKMYYHNLKVRFLKNGIEAKKTFLTRIITFLANSLVVKSSNKSRTGNVFYIRDRDRSAINYLIKIAMSGMASSAGVKNNKKMLRRYKKELEKRHLPPIDFD